MPSPNFEPTATTCIVSPLSPSRPAADGSVAATATAPLSLRDYCFQLELQRRSSSRSLQPSTTTASLSSTSTVSSNRRATPDQDDDKSNGSSHKRPRLGRQERFQFLISVLDEALSIPFDSDDEDILHGAWTPTTITTATLSQTPRSTRDSQ